MVVGTKDDIDKIEPTPADFETAISQTGKIYITYIILYIIEDHKNVKFKFNNVFNVL